VESLRNAGLHCAYDTIRCDTRCYFDVSSKADMSQFNYYHYYVLYYRHNGSKTYSSIRTHTVIHANTSTKKTQKDKNGKKGTELIKHARH